MPRARKNPPARFSIGAERESSLHRALKFRYAGPEGRTEEEVAGFVCDGVSEGGEFVEVQTGSFAPLKEKVKTLTRQGKLRIIHPIGLQKQIEVYDSQGLLLYRRKSPKKGSPWELFNALVYAPLIPLEKNLTIELALVDILETRARDGKGSWRRGGASITGRSLSRWREGIVLQGPEDYRRLFVPFEKTETFTARQLGEKARIRAGLARKCLYVLSKMGILEQQGKKGRAFLYKIREGDG